MDKFTVLEGVAAAPLVTVEVEAPVSALVAALALMLVLEGLFPFISPAVLPVCRKAGVPMPEVGVYDAPEINAFATGANRNNALVAVSTGLPFIVARFVDSIRFSDFSQRFSDPSGGGFDVMVQDTTPPTIVSITASPASLWPPNHKLVQFTLADCAPAAGCSVTKSMPVIFASICSAGTICLPGR